MLILVVKMRLSLFGLVILGSFQWIKGQDDKFNIEIRQPNSEIYHDQSIKDNEFNYGYHVEKVNTQFQHKVKGSDDVTYGCYGYIDPENQKHLYYYVADRRGYRLVTPGQPTKVFTDRVTDSINSLNEDLQEKDLYEKVVAWNDLYLPESCRRLEEIVSNNPTSSTSTIPVTTPVETTSTATTTTFTTTTPESSPTPAIPPITQPPASEPTTPPSCGFTGYVYPVNVTCMTSDVNVALLMNQMETLNDKVIELMANVRSLLADPSTCSTCQSWLTGYDRSPLIVYVPILLPYVSSGCGPAKSCYSPVSHVVETMCTVCK